ncbi:MAG TPA: NHL repeat-containing protein, partial [Longimicrobiales bacterium]|nr:NHL repeat-containing protein [Longimicrobiales bacterium]
MTRHRLAWTVIVASLPALAPSASLTAQIVQKATYVTEGSFDVPDQLSRAPERIQALAWSPADGSVHVAGESGGIFVYDSTGTFLRTYGAQELRRAVALVLDADGRAYALDRERKQVWTFDPEGEALGAIGGRGGDLESLDDPVDLDLGPSGYVYVADKGRGGVQVYSRDGVFVRRVRFGEALRNPRGLAVARDGTIYLTDEDAAGHIVVYDPFTKGSWASSAAGPAGQLPFRGARMDDPERVAVTRFGRVLVLDRDEGRIWTRNPATQETVGANDLLYGGSGSGRGSFREAVDIALVGDEAVLILDRDVRKVEKVRIAFEQDVEELPHLGYPFRVTRGPEILPVRIRGIRHVEGEVPVFVTNAGERAVRLVPGRARRFTTVYGDDARAFAPDPDAEGRIFSQSLRQAGWASLNDSLLAVTDPDEDRFALFSLADGSLLGTFGDNYDDQRELDEPRGIVLMSDGRVTIADKGNDRLVVFSPDLATLLGVYPLPRADRVVVSPEGDLVAWDEEGGTVLRISADGSDRQRVSPALLPERVAGVAFDHLGNLFAVDRESGRVTVLDPTLRRILVRMGTGGRIEEPGGVHTDREGNVYVTDRRDAGQTLVLRWDVRSPVLAGLAFDHGDQAGFRWEPGPATFIHSYQVQAGASPGGPFEVLASTDEPRLLLADAGPSAEEAMSTGRARYVRVAPVIANGQVGHATEPLPIVDFTAVHAYEGRRWERAMEDAAEAVELVRAGELEVPDELGGLLPWIAFEAAYRSGEHGRAVEWIDAIEPEAIERHSLESRYHELVPRAYEGAGEHQRALDAARQALDRIEDGSLDLGEDTRRELMWVAFNSAFQRQNYRAVVGWGDRLRPSVTSSRRVEFFSRLPRAQLYLGAPDSAA